MVKLQFVMGRRGVYKGALWEHVFALVLAQASGKRTYVRPCLPGVRGRVAGRIWFALLACAPELFSEYPVTGLPFGDDTLISFAVT